MKLSNLLALASLALSSVALAHYGQAPSNFNYRSGKAVFVDFEKASYEVRYDFASKRATVESTVVFQTKAAGYPIFDLVADPYRVTIDNSASATETISDPDGSSTLRVLTDSLPAGRHTLKLSHELITNVIFGNTGVASGFWTSDLTDRRYLEQYLPTNLEYDQYSMTINVSVVNAGTLEHVLKTNGTVSQKGKNSFEVTYPDFYSASSLYFHLFPKQNFASNVQFYYDSIDGRKLPIDIYTSYNIDEFVQRVKDVLTELEAAYGAFPHNQVIVYGNAPSGGMEYSGATATALSAVGHELFHSYHARALMPANGNAGWMDEAIARWRDNNYPLNNGVSYTSTRLAGRSQWTRMTDRMAYTEGSAFLSWIAFRMNLKGLSFQAFLRDYFQKYKYTTVTTPQFQQEITAASGLTELTKDFDQYIYGKSTRKLFTPANGEPDPFHPKLTKEQLLQMTWL